jgi:hypothetical protein
MVDGPLPRHPTRICRLAREIVAHYGKAAELVALATAATLMQCGQIEYAEVWQQVASTVSTMLNGG